MPSPTGAITGGGADAVSRRRFISLMGAVGASIAAGTIGSGLLERVHADAVPVADAGAGATTRQWVMLFDLRRCDGCRECIKACQKMHSLTKAQEWIKVYELVGVHGAAWHIWHETGRK